MKYKSLLILILIIFGSLFVNETILAQKQPKIPWQVASKDSIAELINRFSRSLDLNYTNDVDHLMGMADRENQTGIRMFKSLFEVQGDSAVFKREMIYNYLDTAFIRNYSEYSECDNQKCKDSILTRIKNLPNDKLTVYGYIDALKKNFNNDVWNVDFFPGTFGSIQESSLHISDFRYKIASKTYAVDVFARLDFGGTTEEDKAPAEVSFRDLSMYFKVVFEEVKSADGIEFRNYRIGEISSILGTTMPPWEKHILTVSPFLNGGIQSVNGNIANKDIENAYRKGPSQSLELGVLFERKMDLFKNEFTKATVATGFTLFNFAMKSTIVSGYAENSVQPLSEAPFEPSSFLKKYSIASKFSDVSITDKQWFIGLPLRIGLEFNVDRNNKLRGYLQTSFIYYLPFSSFSKATGELNQTGEFTYEHVPGYETFITMDGENNLFPDYFGISNAINRQPVEWKYGMLSKSEAGISLKLKKTSRLEVGPYLSLGTFSFYNSSTNYLAEKGGEVISPIHAMDKLNLLGYGISVVFVYDITKTILTK